MSNSIYLELNSTYKTRNGGIVTIIDLDKSRSRPFFGRIKLPCGQERAASFYFNGSYSDNPTEFDIVEKITCFKNKSEAIKAIDEAMTLEEVESCISRFEISATACKESGGDYKLLGFMNSDILQVREYANNYRIVLAAKEQGCLECKSCGTFVKPNEDEENEGFAFCESCISNGRKVIQQLLLSKEIPF